MNQNDRSSSGFRRVRAAFLDGFDPVTEIVPVRSWPKDAAALRALKKRLVLPSDKGRNKGNCRFRREGYEDDIAVRTTIVSVMVHIEIDHEVHMELAQLPFDQIACDQGVTAAKGLA